MAKFLFSNVIGSFVFDEKYKIVEEVLFKDLGQYKDKGSYEKKLSQRHKDLKNPDENELQNILPAFKDKKYFQQFHLRNVEATKEAIRNSAAKDMLIIQTISAIEDLDKTLNLLAKRLREWYSYYNPESSDKIQEHENFISLITRKTKDALLKDMGIKEENTMGADMRDKDISAIMLLASQANNLYKLRHEYENYLRDLENEACPNFMEVAGITIAAKLIAHAGSMKRLVQMPASTLQIIGAEKALFRHMRNKKKNLPPKFGIIHEHQIIQKCGKENEGKAARALADKMSIAVRVDYFKGKFIGDKLKKGLVDKFKIDYGK